MAVDTTNQYRVYINFEDRTFFETLHPPQNFTIIPRSSRSRFFRLFFQQIWLPIAAFTWADVIHSPSFIMPMFKGKQRHILTIQDMTSFNLPQYHNALRASKPYRYLVTKSILLSDFIQVPSLATKNEILRLLPSVSPDKIRIISYGVTSAFRCYSQDEISPIVERYQINTPYILYLGTLEPRKNLSRLVASYEKLVKQHSVTADLVLAGGKGWKYEELLQQIENSEVKERIHLPGYVEKDDLPILYSGAKLFVYPSVEEGFGLPPLEAMACGVPVITSNCSSLVEYYSEAAVMVDPLSVEDISAAMYRILRDENMQQEYQKRGFSLAEEYRWENTAKSFVACYEELCDMKR